MMTRLNTGDNLMLFPEGTSSDGTRVLPFRSALFGVAQLRRDEKPIAVQSVAIAYTRLDGTRSALTGARVRLVRRPSIWCRNSGRWFGLGETGPSLKFFPAGRHRTNLGGTA
jgi:1-acyl-sn-glycerol-3-phosphate acyltransferase